MSSVAGRERRVGKPDGPTRHVDEWVKAELEFAYETSLWGEGDDGGLSSDAATFTLEQAAAALTQAQAWAAGARLLVKHLKGDLARRLDDGEAYRHGDTIYRRGLKTTRRLIDPAAFVGWCGDDLVRVVRVDPSAVRTTAVKAVCEERGVSPSTVWDTFFEFEDGGDELKTIPLSKAPLWTQKLGEGERGTRNRNG